MRVGELKKMLNQMDDKDIVLLESIGKTKKVYEGDTFGIDYFELCNYDALTKISSKALYLHFE